MMKPIQLVLLSGSDCPLCDTMKEALKHFKSPLPFQVREVDISEHPTLQERYWDRIPYLFVAGRPVAKGCLQTSKLQLALVAAKAGLRKGHLPAEVEAALK